MEAMATRLQLSPYITLANIHRRTQTDWAAIAGILRTTREVWQRPLWRHGVRVRVCGVWCVVCGVRCVVVVVWCGGVVY